MEWFFDNIWLVIFLVWGLPLGLFRSRFRKIVYQTNDWLINIKPLFLKEIKGLFTNLYPDDQEYRQVRNRYRFYLAVYLILFIIYRIAPTS